MEDTLLEGDDPYEQPSEGGPDQDSGDDSDSDSDSDSNDIDTHPMSGIVGFLDVYA
jgi:hypothetical protein